MEVKWQVEINAYARKVLAKQWPDVRRHDDITTFPPKDWTADELRCDLICGGFPCQDISYAGKGAGLDGERSRLFYDAIRVIREVGPRYVLLENVAALLTRGLDAVLGTLASLGFDAEWHCIPAAAVGAPHIRDRVFVLGYSNANSKSTGALHDEAPRLQTHVAHPECERVRVQGRGSDAEAQGRVQGEARERQRLRPDAGSICCDVADADKLHMEGQWPSRQQVAHTRYKERQSQGGGDGVEQHWATEPDVGRVAHGVPARVDRLRCLGNAVVPQVAQWIGRRIMASERTGAG